MKNNYLKFTKEDIIDDLQRLYKKHKYVTSTLYKKEGITSISTVINKFGSFANALSEANIQLIECQKLNINRKRKNPITKEMLISDLIDVFNSTNNTTRENYLSNGKYSRSVINKHFGSWNNCLAELGFKANMLKSIKLNKEDVLKCMLDLYNEYGYINARLQREKTPYSQSIITSMFGSFNNLISELKIREPFVKAYTDEYILSSVYELYKKHGFISCELIEENCSFSFPTLLNHFGSIDIVAKKLNIENYLINSKLSQKYFNILEPYIGKPEKEKTFIWLKNPITNKNLYIDGYYHEHNLAVEVHGRQHYEFVDYFHKDINDFNYNCKLDKTKAKLLNEHDIKILVISYKDNKDIVLQNLFKILQNG